MAMRIFNPDEFDDELVKRGCERLDDESDETGEYWRRQDGKVFRVPFPEERYNGDSGYPDYILDDLIETHDLPAKPIQ